MRTSVVAVFTLLGSLVLLPMAGCTGILGDFPKIPGDDGGGTDATIEDGGDAQADATGEAGGDAAAACSPTTCASGCCDATGKCVHYTTQSGSACGTGGATCGSCGAGESCSNGACSCGGAVCNGCCSSAKKCVAPTNMACGENGATCKACAADQECSAQGQCACDAHTCPNGCCNSSGHCVTTAGNSACGTGGMACATCPSGQECSAGKCTCDATSCPQGCCTASGQCEAFTAQSSTSCGKGGAACGSCGGGQACSGGACTCGGSLCNGCCNGSGQCSTSSNNTCGLNGTACQACPSDQECNSQGTCVCDAHTCPSGCCNSSGTCVTPSAGACGTGGVSCVACGSGQACTSQGQCGCDSSSCPGGCCAGGATGSCELYAAQSGSSCGVGGATCSACGGNQECNKSTGQCVCDGTSCPGGCCTSTVGGSCVAYANESTTQCGSSGAICGSCPQPANSTPTCSGGACGFTCTGGTSMCSGACVNLQNDSANCGACGHSCLGGTCTSATCLPFVLVQPPVSSTVLSIASDGVSLLWVDSGKSGVYQIPVAGGAIVTLASGVSFGQYGAVAVANGKYAFTQTVGAPNIHLWSGSKGVTNGAVQAGTSWSNGSGWGLAMTPDGVNVGFVEAPSSGNAEQVYFVPATTGAGAPIDSPTCSGGGCPSRPGQQVASNGTYIAWAINVLSTVNQGEVGLYNYTTHTKTYPTTAVLYPDFPVLDSSNLYWVDNGNLQIWEMALPAGAPALVMDNGSYSFTGLAVDSTNAYFTLNVVPPPGGVYAVSLSGTQTPVPLYTGGTPTQIIQVGGALFWIDTSSQKIYGMRYP